MYININEDLKQNYEKEKNFEMQQGHTWHLSLEDYKKFCLDDSCGVCKEPNLGYAVITIIKQKLGVRKNNIINLCYRCERKLDGTFEESVAEFRKFIVLLPQETYLEKAYRYFAVSVNYILLYFTKEIRQEKFDNDVKMMQDLFGSALQDPLSFPEEEDQEEYKPIRNNVIVTNEKENLSEESIGKINMVAKKIQPISFLSEIEKSSFLSGDFDHLIDEAIYLDMEIDNQIFEEECLDLS